MVSIVVFALIISFTAIGLSLQQIDSYDVSERAQISVSNYAAEWHLAATQAEILGTGPLTPSRQVSVGPVIDMSSYAVDNGATVLVASWPSIIANPADNGNTTLEDDIVNRGAAQAILVAKITNYPFVETVIGRLDRSSGTPEVKGVNVSALPSSLPEGLPMMVSILTRL